MEAVLSDLLTIRECASWREQLLHQPISDCLRVVCEPFTHAGKVTVLHGALQKLGLEGVGSAFSIKLVALRSQSSKTFSGAFVDVRQLLYLSLLFCQKYQF